MRAALQEFAAAVDEVAEHERRWDLLREAKWSLERWDATRDEADARRCYRSLRSLADLVQIADARERL